MRVYSDTANTREAGTETRVRWRVGGGSYTTLTTSGSSADLNVTGLYGTLEVIVDSFITSNSKYSTYSDSLTMTLTAPPPP
ncbi:hypothetical protein PSV3_00041 [Septimatrevirus PSV31]|uniref:Uncharacterized protein n=1 Tax=Pseudomonas phage PSV3 TaxID=3003632 RepID=A0AAF0APX3_9CAUD|nr:hypothetical protein PM408_gp41 [Pseudomonas phage PSV3]WBF76743.1 hypothetical protein PSV3_00041 [Pseudomonas phage PSV3]